MADHITIVYYLPLYRYGW